MLPARSDEAVGFEVVEQRFAVPLGRWTMTLARPRGPLAELVEAVWTSEAEGVFTCEEILPRSATEVLFSLGERHWLRAAEDPGADRAYDTAWISGLQQRPLSIESPPDARMCGIRLRPAGVAAFLRDSPALIAGAVVDLEPLLGPNVERLRDQLASTADMDRRVRLLADAVERHFDGVRGPSDLVRFALHALSERGGNLPIRSLVRSSGYSHRHLVSRFRAEVGLTPKSYARLVRFESAFARLQHRRRVDWPAFALECGYYDQSHLIGDFRALAGATPTDVLRRLAPDGLGLLVDEADLEHWR